MSKKIYIYSALPLAYLLTLRYVRKLPSGEMAMAEKPVMRDLQLQNLPQ